METSKVYKVRPPINIPSIAADQRTKILNHPYTKTVKEFMLSMIAAGQSYEDEEDLCNMALDATDKLIELTKLEQDCD